MGDLRRIITWDDEFVVTSQGQMRSSIVYLIVDDKALEETLQNVENVDSPSEVLAETDDLGHYSTHFFDALDFLGIPSQAVYGAANIDITAIGEVYEDNVLYSYYYTENARLPDVIQALENVDIKELEKIFNPALFRKEFIYPLFIWVDNEKENLFKDLITIYNRLLDFYRKAKDANANVIIGVGDYQVDHDYYFKVFEPAAAPQSRKELEKWFHEHEDDEYFDGEDIDTTDDDLEKTSANLKNWFDEHERNPPALLYPTQYYFKKDLIGATFFGHRDFFEEACERAMRLAKEHNLGFYDKQTGEIIFPDGVIL